jgi:hypothetical protein
MKLVMKKIFPAFITLSIIIAALTGCEKTTNELLMGRWKLVEVIITKDYQVMDTIDYSKDNIIYDFQKNNRLVISGNIPVNYYVFNDFQKGKHTYRYYYYDDCPNCKPMFFEIDGNRNYKCSAPIWGVEHIYIAGEEITESAVFYWNQFFVKI